MLLDALIATALIAIALPLLAHSARMVARRAQERHQEVLHAIEVENELAFGRGVQAAE